ncbi:hypothetical protein COU91_00880 [Candidatus Saccharibacteria bacterium CG10_big_fil_rev_8_21_14_0_10_47_8]|nr:MAG: hypothetical protein COU91_00880 [Candidatus Saccharibacteria bacterium CG10_big_fil_rev_8_21_14_0_10_47_8]
MGANTCLWVGFRFWRVLGAVFVDKLIVFRKTYDYLFWLKPSVERFTKVHKYSLGIELQASAVRLLRLIIQANYAEIKTDLVAEAQVEHEVQRIFLRLAHDYKLLSPRQFAYASDKLDEIGRLLRGWHKQSLREQTETE